jgi:hypothetical protein
MTRARPALTMTRRRKQVLLELADCAANGERVTLGQLMRRCALYDRSSVKRIMRDLKKMGQLI